MGSHSRSTLCSRFAISFPPSPNGGRAGMPGARCTRGLVCKYHKENAHEHTGPPKSPGIPARNGFTDYSVLSPAIALELPPSPGGIASTDLMPASGIRTTRLVRTRQALNVKSALRVHRSPPRVCDDRETPLCLGRDEANIGRGIISVNRNFHSLKKNIFSGRA